MLGGCAFEVRLAFPETAKTATIAGPRAPLPGSRRNLAMLAPAARSSESCGGEVERPSLNTAGPRWPGGKCWGEGAAAPLPRIPDKGD